MASESEASCDADPNFAVICSFLERFGVQCGLQAVDFVDLQQMLENTHEVSQVLIDLHIKLMRKIRKSITVDRWERGIVKVCHMYSNQDAWEIERFGYKKARLSAKIRLLKELLEMQFDNNTSFKNKINVITAKELRSHPIGRDKLGNAYWYQVDDNCQIRVYKEDPDEETWALVAKDREGLVTLISKLSDNQDSSSTDAVTNDDSNSNNEETKTVIDTGQQDSNSSKKSSDDDKPPVLKHEVDDEDTKMDDKDVLNAKMPELVAPTLQEERKPELSGIKEKYIRSDNFVQPNRKAVESAGFVDIGMNLDMKRPMNDIIDEPTLVKRPRTARPTLLGNKKKPYLQEGEDDWDGDDDEELDEEELDEEEEEDDDEDGEEVGEAIEEPLMLVTGKGAGKDNQCGNPIVGEVVEEEVMYFYGEGSGRECETGNDDKKEETSEKAKESSIKSPTKNSFKLGTIIDTKNNTSTRAKSPRKNATSLWDVGKPTEVSENNTGKESEPGSIQSNKVRSLVDKFESINKKEEEPAAASKAPKFFFGPGSGFSFKAPAPVKTSATLGFGASISAVKSNDNPTPDNIIVNTVEKGESTTVEAAPRKDAINDKDKGSNAVKVEEVLEEKRTEVENIAIAEEQSKKLENHEDPPPAVIHSTVDRNTSEDEAPVVVLTPEHVNSMVSELLKPEIALENEDLQQAEVSSEAKLSNEECVDNPDNQISEEIQPIEEAKGDDITVSKINEVPLTDVPEVPQIPQEITQSETKIDAIDATQEILPSMIDTDNKEDILRETQEKLATIDESENVTESESVSEIVTPTEEVTLSVDQSETITENSFLDMPVDVRSTSKDDTSEQITNDLVESDVDVEEPSHTKEDQLSDAPVEESLGSSIKTGTPIQDQPIDEVSSCDIAHLAQPESKEKSLQDNEPSVSCVPSEIISKKSEEGIVESVEAETKQPGIKTNEEETPDEKELGLSDEPLVICIEITKPEDITVTNDVPVEEAANINTEVNTISSEVTLSRPTESPKEAPVEQVDATKPLEIDATEVSVQGSSDMVEPTSESNAKPPEVAICADQISPDSLRPVETDKPQDDDYPKLDLIGTHDTISECMDVESPMPTSLSIGELIKEVPLETQVDFPLRPALDIAIHANVEQPPPQVEPAICSKDLKYPDSVCPEDDLQEEESLLDLSCTKVTSQPQAPVEPTPLNPYLQPDFGSKAHDFSKEQSESQFARDYSTGNPISFIPPSQVDPIAMPVGVAKSDPRCLPDGPDNVSVIPQLVPPPAPYIEPDEQVEEISVAKSFLMDNDAGAAANVSDHQEESIDEPVVIQEIGSMPSGGYKKPALVLQEISSIEAQIRPLNEEEDIVKIRLATNAPSVLEVQVPEPGPPPPVFAEIPCEKQTVALLGDDDDHSDDMMYDDGNVSEPMDLEDSKDGQIIERPESERKTESEEDSVIPDDKLKAQRVKDTPVVGVAKVVEEEPAEPKKPSLQSFTLDYTGEAPDLSHVHALTRRSLKRGANEEQARVDDQEEAGGKRRKMRGKRAVDKELRKSVETRMNKDVSSSDEDKKKEDVPETKPEKKPRQKRKRLVMGLEIPEEGVEVPTGLRQSRRIAQIKIKEEAERRKLEEIALEEMKNAQTRKVKKDDDKDYKAEKRKHNKITTEEETTNDAEVEEKKKKKQRKHKEFDEKNPWRSSSDSSSEDSHVEDEEEEEEENYIETVKSDHEFSPESDLENAADPQPLKRARTVRKEDEEEDDVDDYSCQKCTKSDHPEWILLCDGCDAGWHCSCLRPALFVIPEGDWYCPPCQHNSLIKLLQENLVEFDKVQSKKEVELRRKERLAYVGISLANVLPEKTEDAGQKAKKERIRKPRVRISGDESSSSSESGSSGSESGSSSGSDSSSSDSDEPIYKLRQRSKAHSYQFKEYDDLIKSATQEDVVENTENEPQVRGKDMATIVQAEMEENKGQVPKEDDSEEDVIKPVRKVLGKKKHRRLNSLDISSEEDEDSDEDFKGSSSDEDEDDYDDYNESSSNSSIIGRKKKGRRGSVRRSTRARINRYDREFINDDSEDSDDRPLGKRGRGSDWEESDESEEESDRSWGRRKKKGGAAKATPASISTTKHKKSKKKRNDDSDPDSYKKRKPKIKFGGLDVDEGGKRRTRGKKINYLDVLGSDSDEEPRRNQVKDEESEDEFVLNEEEEDVPGEEGREDASSDDSNIGGLIPAVKKGSKKGMGKGGIKRIKRSQYEEEEALFPPIPDATSGEVEPNTIEQINKNLEAMDEKEIGEMMEDEEYANRQLQMVAAQLEKDKRRKEMEARRLEMLPQPAAVPAVREVSASPSVIQAMPVSMPPQIMPPHLHQMHADQPQPIQHDLSHPAMHHQLPPMHHSAQMPHLSPHSPQHLLHHPVPPHQQSPMMMMGADTPKKRGRKPRSHLTSPEVIPAPFISTPPSMGDKSDDSELSYNADGTPRKRRGRGKGKKTLEKEAAVAAALAAAVQSPTLASPSPPSKPPEAKEPPERPPESKPAATPDIPPIPMVGGKLGVASAPQPFSQSQPKPSVITRMLQTQPGQPAYPVGGAIHNFSPDRPPEPRPQGHPFVPGGGPPPGPAGMPPRALHPGAFRPGANHYAVIRSGAPPIRSHLPPHMYHHPMENVPLGGPPLPERSSPALTSPSSASPLSNKSDPTPPPPAYAVRPPMVRYPPASTAPPGGMPLRHPQLLPQMHPTRPPFTSPPHNYHYPPQYPDAGSGSAPYQPVPPPYQDQQQFAGDEHGPKNYEEEENGEFGGLVSYFSSQREDDLDT